MKRILALVLICMMAFAGAAFAEESKGTLSMGTNAAFPPYEYYDDETGEIVGIDAEEMCIRDRFAADPRQRRLQLERNQPHHFRRSV